MSIKDWSTTKKVTSGCLVVTFLAIGGCGAFVFGILSLLKSSDAYETGLRQVQSNTDVQELIGEPIVAGVWLSGSIETTGSSGDADIFFPVSGPKGSGLVSVVGKKTAGSWKYSTLTFTSDSDGQIIDLQSQAAQ